MAGQDWESTDVVKHYISMTIENANTVLYLGTTNKCEMNTWITLVQCHGSPGVILTKWRLV